MSNRPHVHVARIYEPARPDDGTRVLVDRIWPRGLSKSDAHLDEWCKQIAPSARLRTWYAHEPSRFTEFSRRYRLELDAPEPAAALAHLRQVARRRTVTLLTATKEIELSQATVLADLIRHPEQAHDDSADDRRASPERRPTRARDKDRESAT